MEPLDSTSVTAGLSFQHRLVGPVGPHLEEPSTTAHLGVSIRPEGYRRVSGFALPPPSEEVFDIPSSGITEIMPLHTACSNFQPPYVRIHYQHDGV